MINKNKFSIKNTKKVLHKVGKRWVVVSAVLLGLAAGGAAVTTANADTTAQAVQPTVAQQVTKNANMSAANHSFGAADPANATKAPASTATMKLGAEQGNNGSINIKGHNVPTTKQGIENDAKHYASYANVYNLSALASKADTNNAKSQYSDLVNLASKAPSQFNSYEVGSDASTNSNANTLFGILNDASADISAINNGNSNSKLTKISHALSDVQSLALNTSYRSGDPIKLSVPNVTVPVSESGSVVLGNTASAVNSAIGSSAFTPTTTFSVTPLNSNYNTSSANASMSASVSVNIPNIINSGISESTADSLVSSLVHAFASNASANVTPNAKAFAESLASSNNLTSQVANDIYTSLTSSGGVLSNAVKDAVEYNNAYTKYNSVSSEYSTLSSAAGEQPNEYIGNIPAQRALNNLLTASGLNSMQIAIASNAVKAHPSLINHYLTQAHLSDILTDAKVKLNTVHVPSSIDPALLHDLQSESMLPSEIQNDVTGNVKTLLSKKLNLNPIIDNLVEGKIHSFLDGNNGYAQGQINELDNKIHSFFKLSLHSNMFGPFANNNISNASDYIDDIQGALGNLPSPFNNPNKISKANDALDAVNNGISDASDIASDVAKNPNMSSEYNAVVNSAANLASDLPNNVSAYNDYNSMYTNASLLAGGLSAAHNRTANHIMTNVAVPASNIAQTYLTSDNIVFNGDSAANFSTSKGIKGTTSSVSAPSGYHFNDNKSQETITFNGSTYTFDVAKNSANPKPSSGKSKSSASNSAQSNNNDFIPTFNGGSSMVSGSTSTSASAEPSMASGTRFSAESKARYANYVLVTKALQLHTRANFTKKNGVAVIKPGVVLNVEKTVRARHGLVRYEVRYNNKNYFVTANKHFGVYDSYELAKPSHYRYAKVDTALQLHQSTNFTKKNGVKVVKPGMEFRINRVVKSNKGVIRYEVNYKGSVYFITANAHYVENAYLQKSNFKRGRKAVRVIKPLNEYRRANFTKHGLVRHFSCGIKLHVSRVRTIAKGEVTRLQLTNGHYVTANKDFVKVIK